jgi:hypothetical protein
MLGLIVDEPDEIFILACNFKIGKLVTSEFTFVPI